MKIIESIPIVRSFLREYRKVRFQKKWRLLNSNNETVAGNIFPIDIVSIGKGSYGLLNIQSLFPESGESLIIGNYVSIAPGALFILGGNHQVQTISTYPFHSKLLKPHSIDAESKGAIIIEDEVWIGTNAIIMSGVKIMKGAIIAAGAVVTKNVPPYAIVGGNPGRVIKYRLKQEVIDILYPLKLSDLPPNLLRENLDLLYKKIDSTEDALLVKNQLEKNLNGQ